MILAIALLQIALSGGAKTSGGAQISAPSAASGPITAGASAQCYQPSGASCAATTMVTQGETLVLSTTRASTANPATVSAPCTSNWTDHTYVSGGWYLQTSTATVTVSGSCQITVTTTGSSVAWIVQAYNGVISTANHAFNSSAQSSVTCSTPSITTSAPNSVVVGLFFVLTSPAITPLSGSNLRINANMTTARMALTDTGVPAVSAVTTGINISPATDCMAATIELVSQTVQLGGPSLSGSCPIGAIDVPYSCTLAASGGTPPYTYANSGTPNWPPGLSLSGNTITGTPTTNGVWQSNVQVTDSLSATAIGTISITISSGSGTAHFPQIWANPHEADLPSPCAAPTCYNKTVKVAGGDYACTIAGLNQLVTDWAATAPDVWWHVAVDDTLSGNRCLVNETATWMLKGKTTAAPSAVTGFLIIESAHPNSSSQILCNHIPDNGLGNSLAGPTPRNPGCTNDMNHLWGLEITSTSVTYSMSFVNATSTAAAAANHVVVRDVELSRVVGGSWIPVDMSYCSGAGSTGTCATPVTPNLFPNHVGVQRVYFHGDYNDEGWSPSGQLIVNQVQMFCSYCWLENNYLEGGARGCITGVGHGCTGGGEGHGISLTQAQGAIKIAHNFIESGEITILSGGAQTWVKNVSPHDIELRGNVATMNPAWMQMYAGYAGVGWQGCKVSSKNRWEYKIAVRYLADGNLIENNISCAQDGLGIINATGSAGATGSWAGAASGQGQWDAAVTDPIYSNNVLRHGINGIGNASRSGASSGNGDGLGLPGRRWNYINNLFYDINNAGGTRSGQTAYILRSGGGPAENMSFTCGGTRNSTGTQSTLTCVPNQSFQVLYGPPPWGQNIQTDVGDLVWVHNCTTASFNGGTGANDLVQALTGTSSTDVNVDPEGRTLVYANSGPANEIMGTWATYNITSVSRLAGSTSVGGTCKVVNGVSSCLTDTTVTYTGTPELQVGQHIYLQGVMPSGAITSANSGGFVGGFVITAVPGSGQATFQMYMPANGLAVPVTPQTAGTMTALSNGTGCTLRIGFGQPFDYVQSHNTYAFAGALQFPAMSGANSFGCVRAEGAIVQDEIAVQNPNATSTYGVFACSMNGVAGQRGGWDTNSLTWNHDFYSNTTNPPMLQILNFGPGFAATGTPRTDPSNTIWITSPVCSTSTADATCLGWNGIMNSTAWVDNPGPGVDPLVYFSLVPSSVYKAGGSRQAHDSTDMGANMEQIRTHMNATQFTCPSAGACGPAGPYPD